MEISKQLNTAIQDLCKEHNITILPPKYKRMTGWAYFDIRSISIPPIIGGYTFLVALHEIYHILLNDVRDVSTYKYDYILEYEVECMTIESAKLYPYITEDELTEYIKQAKLYVNDKFLLGEESPDTELNKTILNWINEK